MSSFVNPPCAAASAGTKAIEAAMNIARLFVLNIGILQNVVSAKECWANLHSFSTNAARILVEVSSDGQYRATPGWRSCATRGGTC